MTDVYHDLVRDLIGEIQNIVDTFHECHCDDLDECQCGWLAALDGLPHDATKRLWVAELSEGRS